MIKKTIIFLIGSFGIIHFKDVQLFLFSDDQGFVASMIIIVPITMIIHACSTLPGSTEEEVLEDIKNKHSALIEISHDDDDEKPLSKLGK